MRLSTGILLAATLFAASPAMAGTLTVENGQTIWHSTQCTKPAAPGSVLAAQPETSGEDMNSMVGQHNAYADAMQAYMICVSNEAEHDQVIDNQAIVESAQKIMGAAKAEVDGALPASKYNKE